MQSSDEIEKLFLEKVKPFEDQIRELESREDENQKKIASLKELVFSLTQILEQIGAHQAPVKHVGGAATAKTRMRTVWKWILMRGESR